MKKIFVTIIIFVVGLVPLIWFYLTLYFASKDPDAPHFALPAWFDPMDVLAGFLPYIIAWALMCSTGYIVQKTFFRKKVS